MAKHNPNALCLCGTGQKYKRCCRPIHRGQLAHSPEALMRARYVAYALGLTEFIMASTDRDGPHWEHDAQAWRASIEKFMSETCFVGLKVHEVDMHDPLTGTVLFTASLRQDGKDASFSERSGFVNREGNWLYSWGDPSGSST